MSLQGEALRRWYLRSPDDIEQERQNARTLRYQAFFGRGQATSQALKPENQNGLETAPSVQPNQPQRLWISTGPKRWSSRLATPLGSSSLESWDSGRNSAHEPSVRGTSQQLAANSGFCVACHGPGLPPPPPSLANPPNWPPWTPRPNTAPRKPAGPNPSQCAMQYENDSAICRRQPNKVSREMCWESAAKREAYCIEHKGEIGSPRLFTHD